ncbi:Protein PSP1 [Nakaseomyces bracarensis]|uniref:Protein PSP1 n=1 Tax=Nakaseomyces bracarensis TaxID=273131 RepID=A0ABR4NQC1_9SACH
MELPSISSTTSISDNADLRNYYEKLLFKNNSGKSLTDLQNRALNKQDSDDSTLKDPKFDFINGFKNRNSTAAAGGNSSGNTAEPLAKGRVPFSGLRMTPLENEQRNVNPGIYSNVGNNNVSKFQDMFSNYNIANKNASQNDNLTSTGTSASSTNGQSQNGSHSSPFNDFAMPELHKFQSNPVRENREGINSINTWENQRTLLSEFEAQQSRNEGRRSSYISDTLIHGQYDNNIPPANNDNARHNSTAVGGMDAYYNNTYKQNRKTSNDDYMNVNSFTPTNSAPYSYKNYSNILPMISNLNISSEANYNNNQMSSMNQRVPQQINPNMRGASQDMHPYPYSNMKSQHDQQQKPLQQQYQMRYNNNYNHNSQNDHAKNQQSNDQNNKTNSKNHIMPSSLDFSICKANYEELQSESGLLLLAGRQIVSTPILHQLYLECGANYFSSDKVFAFTDFIKSQLADADSISKGTPNTILQFLEFLKNCNSGYFKGDKQAKDGGSPGNNSSSNHLSYKPLVLVSLKNGKLELLSTPQTTNLLMKRGDLVIIDGDRGKDLVIVVEHAVDLNLALFVNFLKKKIHFDSLITNRNQHISNYKFIELLVDSKDGQSNDINPKLYDIVELTELIIPSKQVLRFATPWEVSTNLHNKFQDELRAMHIARSKLSVLNDSITNGQQENEKAENNTLKNKTALNIKILNAEFQFDRKKLTFYYVCEERNDFRELIKELFKFYKTRIWLCALPNNLEVDTKYYDAEHKELNMYQDMIEAGHQSEIPETLSKVDNSTTVAPPLNKLELDNFQIGVYKELVNQLFNTNHE